MKAIQISMDEELLRAFDADEEVRRVGRSAVFRGYAREYLRRRREREIDEQYRRAYGKDGGYDPEWEGWENEAVWLDEWDDPETTKCPDE